MPLWETTGTATTSYGNDWFGSVTARVGPPATVGIETESIYDAFGNPTVTSGTPTTPHASTVGYRGQLVDNATSQVYLRNRFYSPDIGRFTRSDPIRSGSNFYAYAGGDPVNNWDPMGLRVIVAKGASTRFTRWLRENTSLWLRFKLDCDRWPTGSEGVYTHVTRWYPESDFVRTGLQMLGGVGETIGHWMDKSEYRTRFSEVSLTGVPNMDLLTETDMGVLGMILSDEVFVFDSAGWRMKTSEDQGELYARVDLALGRAERAVVSKVKESAAFWLATTANTLADVGDFMAEHDDILIPLEDFMIQNPHFISACGLGATHVLNRGRFFLSSLRYSRAGVTAARGLRTGPPIGYAKVADFAADLVRSQADELAELGLGPYRMMHGHHLNQVAAYGTKINRWRSVSIGSMRGGITGPTANLAHVGAHEYMEGWWNLFRRGGPFHRMRPTNAQYTAAQLRALRHARLSEAQARFAIRAAIRERVGAGLLGGLEVPAVPEPIRAIHALVLGGPR